MARTRVPIDGEPNALIAWPIPEVGDLRFVELLRRYYDALGRSGGIRLVWRPLDDPRRTDEAYEKLRTTEFDRALKDEVCKFDKLIADRGGADHHLSREYTKLATTLMVSDASRPCIVLGTRPKRGRDIVIGIPPHLLTTREGQNALASALVAALNEDLVTGALNTLGFLDNNSMRKIEDKVRESEAALRSLRVLDATSLAQVHTKYAALVVTRDDRRYVTKSDLDALLDDRGAFDLIIDVPRCRALYCRSHRLLEVHIRNRAIRLVAAVMEAERPISMDELNEDWNSKELKSAYNTFCEARTIIQRKMPHEPGLYRTIRTGDHGAGRFEFTPSTSLKWAVVLPPDGLNM